MGPTSVWLPHWGWVNDDTIFIFGWTFFLWIPLEATYLIAIVFQMLKNCLQANGNKYGVPVDLWCRKAPDAEAVRA